jgi:energy-coupling factor transporter ATP-binding protein EcfA2
MLFIVSGSSGAGKTTLATAISGLVSRLHVHELGEIAEEPWSGDVYDRWWRRNLTERWLQHAIELETAGEDLLLTEGVLGEVLAAPSATQVSGIAACLLDCEDDERIQRLEARGQRAPDSTQLGHMLNWSTWLRGHAADPQFWRNPILHDGDTSWHWDRWVSWQRGDPRWSVFVIDTSGESPKRSADRMAGWIEEQRNMLTNGALPLSGNWPTEPRREGG